MDGAPLDICRRRLAVDGVPENVEHSRENSLATRRLSGPPVSSTASGYHAEEEIIDLDKVVHGLLQESLRDLVAESPMRAVFPGILYSIFLICSSTSSAPSA